jgi:hypothetical protein
MRNTRIFLLFFWFVPFLLSVVAILLHVRSTTLEATFDWPAIGTLVTALSSIFVMLSYFAIQQQATTAQDQLSHSTLAAKTSILLALFKDIEDEREERSVIFLIENNQREGAIDDADPNKKWTEKELKAANTVVARFNTAGFLIVIKLIDRELFLAEWRDNLCRLDSILQHYIARERKKRGPNLWASYDR